MIALYVLGIVAIFSLGVAADRWAVAHRRRLREESRARRLNGRP